MTKRQWRLLYLMLLCILCIAPFENRARSGPKRQLSGGHGSPSTPTGGAGLTESRPLSGN